MFRKYPAIPFLISTIIGIIAADIFNLSAWPLLILAFIIFGSSIYFLLRENNFYLIISLTIILALISAFHFALKFNEQGPNDIRSVVKPAIIYDVYAQVSDWPNIKNNQTELRLEVDSLSYERDNYQFTKALTGGLLLKISDTTASLQRGDRVSLRGRIYLLPEREVRFGDFDYSQYLNLKGVYGTMFLPTLHSVKVDRRLTSGYFPLVDNIRSLLLDSFKRNLSPLSAALAGGFLIGETRDIPPSVYESFRDSGTLHLLAVSGSNVALIILFALFLMRPIRPGRITRSVLLMGTVIIFAGISYGDPSVMRASIMAALIIIARLLSRTHDLNNVIALTALIILLVEPAQFFDVGFQLSFITAWGLIFIIPKVISIFEKVNERRWYRWILLPLIISAVAQVCSMPIIAYYFGKLPLLSLPANLLIVPAVSIGVLGILVMLVADLILPILGLWLGSLVDIWLRFIIELLEVFGGDNVSLLNTGGLFQGLSGLLFVLILYILIGLGTMAIKSKVARRGLLLFIMIVFNTLLISEVVKSDHKGDIQIEYRSIPGGISMMIYSADSHSCDLVITSISGRNYPIDEKIIAPNLIENNIDSISNLFLLSSDFRSLDDIIRLAVRFNTSRLYIQPNMLKSLGDVSQQAEGLQFQGEIIPLQELSENSDKYGYSFYKKSLIIDTEKRRLEIQTDISRFFSIDAKQDAISQTYRNKTIIVGSGRSLKANDWGKLLTLGYKQIICSKIEQSDGEREFDIRLESENYPPSSIIELSKVSFYRQIVSTIPKAP